MPETEVKARLTIEQDGEPQALRDAATAVMDLGTAAATATPRLEGLRATAEGIEATLQRLTAGLQAAGAASAGAFAPLLAELDQVIAKANAAAAALSQITGR